MQHHHLCSSKGNWFLLDGDSFRKRVCLFGDMRTAAATTTATGYPEQRYLTFLNKIWLYSKWEGQAKAPKEKCQCCAISVNTYSYVMLIFYQLLHFSNSRHCTVTRMQVEFFQISKQLRKGTWKGTCSLTLTTPTTRKLASEFGTTHLQTAP